MQEIIQALILGIVQGATEFIPVSSSGHLVIVPWLFGWDPSPLLFDTILHWGTLTAIIIVFWRDFLRHLQGDDEQHFQPFSGRSGRAPGLVYCHRHDSGRRSLDSFSKTFLKVWC